MGKAKLYPGEKVLDANETVFCGEWYLLNNRPYRSYYGGTVAYLKEVLSEEKNIPVVGIEIKYCNKFARRLS